MSTIVLVILVGIIAILVGLVALCMKILPKIIVSRINSQIGQAQDFETKFPMYNMGAKAMVESNFVLWISGVKNPEYVDKFLQHFGAAFSELDIDPAFSGSGLRISYVLNGSNPSPVMAEEMKRLQAR